MPDLDAWVERTLETFEVPGVAVTIVKDGEVVLARGYGVRRIGESTPVDERTRFGIASNTKAFTATALGLLVEDGKLEWDGLGDRLPAVVPHVGPVGDPRDHGEGSPGPPERPGPRAGGSVVLAGVRISREERSSRPFVTWNR